MLCQAILSAVAVTCTFSCIHAYGQSTQRSNQIKDLMCVLILSGIQKEDLDASMLRKLQRHNVNIDDLNNDEMVNKCKDFNLKDIEKQIASTTLGYTTLKSKDMLTIKPKVIKKISSVLTLQENFLNPVKYKENYISQTKTEVIATIHDQEILNEEAIEYTDGKPKLESVLKFWNNYVTNKKDFVQLTSDNPSSLIMENDSNREQKNKQGISKYQNPKVKDVIKKVLSNLLHTKKNDEELCTKQSTVLNNVSEELLASGDTTYKLDELKNKYSLSNILDNIESNNQKYGDTYSQEYTTMSSYISFKEMLASIDKRTAYPFAYEAFLDEDNSKHFEKGSKINHDSLKPDNDSLKKKAIKSPPAVTQDIIKYIADTVKTIVLRDIRKEIQTTMSDITTPLTTTSDKNIETVQTEGINEQLKTNNHILHESVLKKFLELFDNIKTLKKNPIIITREDKNVFKSENTAENLTLRSLTDFLPKVDQKALLNIKYVTPVNNIPEIPEAENKFNHQTLKFKSNPVIDNEPPLIKKTMPITIQTNALEIPPIGVFLNNPENPIGQNIIVSTISPNQIRNGRYIAYGSITDIHDPAKNINKYEFGSDFKNAQIKEEKEKIDRAQPIPKPYCSTHDCTHYRSKFNGIQTNNNHRQKSKDMRFNRYMAYSSDTSEKKHFTMSGFHEKLEKSDNEWTAPKTINYKDCCYDKGINSSQRFNCCQKISARQQMSLNPIKRISYDDSHFNNFLKSQQKVTEMLERILAVKNRLRSVEAI